MSHVNLTDEDRDIIHYWIKCLYKGTIMVQEATLFFKTPSWRDKEIMNSLTYWSEEIKEAKAAYKNAAAFQGLENDSR